MGTPASTGKLKRRDFKTGDTVQIYRESHYNQRGIVKSLRALDALGDVDVEVAGKVVRLHRCDLELVQSAACSTDSEVRIVEREKHG